MQSKAQVNKSRSLELKTVEIVVVNSSQTSLQSTAKSIEATVTA